jgi:hypothetical protein
MENHTITDNFGLVISVSEDTEGTTVAKRSDGLEIDWPTIRSDAQILDTFNAHIPAGWVPPLADQQAAKSALADTTSDAIFAGGYYVSAGTLAGQTLQVRDETDKTNWLASAVAYSAAIANGMGTVAGAMFRTSSNQNFTVTFNEGLQVLLSMQTWGGTIDAACWALKDRISAATDQASLDAIDVSAGWPA